MYEMRCLVCDKSGPSKMTRAALDWDWFHGHLPMTVHFCPRHKRNELHDRLLEISKKRPETWTREEINFAEALSERVKS